MNSGGTGLHQQHTGTESVITGREGVASGKDCNNWKQSWRRGECRPGGTPGCQASFHRRSSGADGEWVGG